MAILSFMLIPAAAAAQTVTPPEAVARFELPRMPREGEQLVLTRLDTGDRLSIRRSGGPARLPALPLGADLLPGAAASAFGVEERCRLEAREGGLDLICTPGTSAAGLLLRFDARYPQGAAVSGAVDARGSPGFALQFGHRGDDAGRPRALAGGGGLFPIPGGPAEQAAQLVVLSPPEGGTLRIGRVALAPSEGRPGAQRASGAWAWEPRLWRGGGEALLRDAAARGLGQLSITLEVRDGRVADAEALAAFVHAARRRGIAVEAVEGDPDMVLERGLASALLRARAIAAYQSEAAPDARLAGVQYDIEPYTLAAWGQEPVGWRGWAEAVRTLARGVGAPVHLVLPFWIAEEEEGRAFLARVEAAVSGVTVMAYRTDSAAISSVAEPLLSWGSARGKPVRVALETGPVAAETEERFVPAETGRIAVAEARGGKAHATLLAATAALPASRMFAPAGRTLAAPTRISFLGDDRRMIETIRALAAPLAAWSSFDGFAFHGLRWAQP